MSADLPPPPPGPGAPDLGPPAGYWALLRDNPDFTRLFLGRNVSLLGDWFNTLGLLALLREAGETSATSFGWVLIFKTLPVLFAAPIAGVLSDRLNRKTLMIVSDALRFLLVLGMLLPAARAHPALLYALVILQTVGMAVSEPARLALIPDLVAPRDLMTAGAVTATSWSLMLALGSALGGATVEAFGWEVTLGVDALSYLASVALLLGLKAPPAPAAPPRPAGRDLARTLGLRDMAEGLAYLRERPRIASMVAVKVGMGAAIGGIMLVMTVYGEEVHPIGAAGVMGVALLYAARSVGTGVGPILARALVPHRGAAMEWAIAVGFLVAGIGYAAFAFAGHIALAFACVALAHLGGATVYVFSTVRLQEMAPSRVLGRIFATEQGLFTLASALSTYAFGFLLDARPVDVRLIALGVPALFLGAAVLWVLRLVRLGAGGDPDHSPPKHTTVP